MDTDFVVGNLLIMVQIKRDLHSTVVYFDFRLVRQYNPEVKGTNCQRQKLKITLKSQ